MKITDKLALKQIEKYIKGSNLKRIKKIEIADVISSTNDYLLKLSANNKNDVYVCLAEQQTAGRGRQGKHWISPHAANIYLSLLWPFEKSAGELTGLSLAIATVVTDVLAELGIKKNIGLKWPNDIVWKNNKLSGILIEISRKTRGSCKAVIGIGINVNMPKEAGEKIDCPWISLNKISAKKFNRNKIAGLLINKLVTALLLFQKQGLSAFIKRWEKLDILNSKEITIANANKQITGIARGINSNGCILLENKFGKLQTFSAGEIILGRLDNGGR